MAPPWPLTSSYLTAASVYHLLDFSSFSLLSTLFLHSYFSFVIFFVSVPIHHPSDQKKLCTAVTSFETDIYMHRKYNKTTQVIRGTLHACSVCGLFAWSTAAGFLAFSSRQFALTIKHLSLSALHYFAFLSKSGGRRMPPAERSALYILLVHTYKRTQ